MVRGPVCSVLALFVFAFALSGGEVFLCSRLVSGIVEFERRGIGTQWGKRRWRT